MQCNTYEERRSAGWEDERRKQEQGKLELVNGEGWSSCLPTIKYSADNSSLSFAQVTLDPY